MADLLSEIDAALAGDNLIPRDTVLRWIEAAADLSTLSKLYRLTDESYYRIQPGLGKEVTCVLIQRYLLKCIRENVTGDDNIENRFDATQLLLQWFFHLLDMEGTSTVLKAAARAVTELFLACEEDVRYTIETGFLEHALETPALRPYFQDWSSNPRLKETWERAMEWARDHPDFTRKLFGSLPNDKRK